MTENLTPRQILDGLLRGLEPPRPLFLPIVFSLGAKLENLPLSAFLSNATKLSNSLRQIHSRLRADGLSCYFDRYLEAEALGGALEWNTEERPTIHWPGRAVKGELPEGIRSPEAAAKRGRVGVALDVIRRLKSLVRDGSLLMAGVTGPFTLAARLTQFEEGDSLRSEHRPDDALEVAASLMMHLSAVYVEAGANLVFIQEEVLPRLSSESCEAWAERLAPAFNLIRFYQALPVLHLTGHRSFAENSEVILQQPWNCLVCPTLDVTSSRATQIFRSGDMIVGIALPLEVLQPDKTSDEDLDRFLHHTMSELRPAILTTAGDVPAGTDLKRLKRVSAFCR